LKIVPRFWESWKNL